MYRHSTFITALTVVIFLLNLPVARAQEIEEITVTADYRRSGINDIDASISVLDETLIQKKNAQHIEDILINAPNVNFASGASRARFYQIRGIGERGQFTEPLNPSVGVIIDGVDFSGIGNAALLYDVEQVEILLGPQGTRYGSNALAGLINLRSKEPTEELSYGMQLEAANYDSGGIAGYVSGPVSEQLGFRLSGQNIQSDGFSENLYLQRPTNTRDETTIRGKLRWQPNEDVRLDLNTALIDMDNGYDMFSLDNVRDTLSDQPGFDRQESMLLSANLNVDTSQLFTLEAIAGFGDSDIAYGYDEDWVYSGFHPFGYSSTDHYFRDRETLSAELRLLSKESAALFNDTTDWVAGVYSLQQEVDLTRQYTYLPADFSSRYSIDRLALYTETNTTLSDELALTIGVRIEDFSGDYDDANGLFFNPDDTLFGGKLALNYYTQNDNLVYLSASRGYKTGGFNIDGSLDADLREFDSENLWNYELGFKGLVFNDRLQTRIAVFYMDRDDVQISSSTVRVRNDGSAEFIEYTGNAAAGNNYGMELTGNLQATDFIALSASLGLLQSEYENFVNSAGEDLDGREQAHAPEYQFTLGMDLSLAENLLLNVNLQGKDAFYFSDSHPVRSRAYELLNASLTWDAAPWRLTLWGRNLTDEDYYIRGFYFGNDPRDNYTAKGYTQLGEPMRYGLTLNMDF